MSRPLRIEYAGAVYHITARGNAQQTIYEDDVDRRQFLALLGREVEQQHWLCHGYCLMRNHYHLVLELVLETPEANLSRRMAVLMQCTASGSTATTDESGISFRDDTRRYWWKESINYSVDFHLSLFIYSILE